MTSMLCPGNTITFQIQCLFKPLLGHIEGFLGIKRGLFTRGLWPGIQLQEWGSDNRNTGVIMKTGQRNSFSCFKIMAGFSFSVLQTRGRYTGWDSLLLYPEYGYVYFIIAQESEKFNILILKAFSDSPNAGC